MSTLSRLRPHSPSLALQTLLAKRPALEAVFNVLNPVLGVLPTVVKWTIALLFLVNFRSWPFVWHFKIWRPIWKYQFRVLFVKLSVLFKSREEKKLAMANFLESISAMGKNPFEVTRSYKTWASPDDCDFNMHLSNSCYAKQLDMARFTAAINFVPTAFIAGVWMGVGATHFKFLREIPIFSVYEMRTSIASWDHKWMYVLTRFVTKSKKKRSKKLSQPNSPPIPTPPVGPPLIPPTHTPATLNQAPSSVQPQDEYLKELLAKLEEREEEDGATLHCVVITEICLKMGRITVPPAIVLALDGYHVPPLVSSHTSAAAASLSESTSTSFISPTPPSSPPSSTCSTDLVSTTTTKPSQPPPSSSSPSPYSHSNPPPTHQHIHALKPKGDMRPMQQFLKGGWKEVSENERWWVGALAGEIEERRRLNFDLVSGVQRGMEGAKYV